MPIGDDVKKLAADTLQAIRTVPGWEKALLDLTCAPDTNTWILQVWKAPCPEDIFDWPEDVYLRAHKHHGPDNICTVAIEAAKKEA